MNFFRYSCLLLTIFITITMAEIPIASYDEIKDLPNHPEKLLIDVREPHELENTGQIPTSINIPRKCLILSIKLSLKNFNKFLQVGQVRRSFSDELSDREFEILYRIKKPKLEDYLLFTCRTGRRSAQAAAQVIELGYKK